MKSKSEFTEAFANELAGLLLSAWTMKERGGSAEKGMFMMQRLESVRHTLEKMYDFIAEVKPDPIKGTAETLTDDLAVVYPTLNQEMKDKCKERLRKLFVPETNGKLTEKGK